MSAQRTRFRDCEVGDFCPLSVRAGTKAEAIIMMRPDEPDKKPQKYIEFLKFRRAMRNDELVWIRES